MMSSKWLTITWNSFCSWISRYLRNETPIFYGLRRDSRIMLSVRSSSPVLLFIRLSPPTSAPQKMAMFGNHFWLNKYSIIRIFVNWKQQIAELNIEYSFDPWLQVNMRMRGLGVLFTITTVVSWCVHIVLRLMLSKRSMGAGRAPGCGV